MLLLLYVQRLPQRRIPIISTITLSSHSYLRLRSSRLVTEVQMLAAFNSTHFALGYVPWS